MPTPAELKAALDRLNKLEHRVDELLSQGCHAHRRLFAKQRGQLTEAELQDRRLDLIARYMAPKAKARAKKGDR